MGRSLAWLPPVPGRGCRARRLPYFVVVLPALCCQPSPVVVAPFTTARYAPPTPPSPPGATPSAAPEPRPPPGPATEAPVEPARPPPSCPSGMVPILGGTAHLTGEHVTVVDFCLDRTEVTAGQYRSCAASRACSDVGLLCDSAATYATPTKRGHPINCTDAIQAASFCRTRGKRLPTDEEWWWAARGAKRAWLYPWGNKAPNTAPTTKLCWSGLTPTGGTCPVGAFPDDTSADGVQDLAGNVSEWTSSDAGLGTVFFRGGSWSDTKDVTVAIFFFFAWPSSTRLSTMGFRCAMGAHG